MTFRMVAAQVRGAQEGDGAEARSARRWLAACPWLESGYENQEAWYLAQSAAASLRAAGHVAAENRRDGDVDESSHVARGEPQGPI